MSTVGQIVNQLIESLSDGISQLVLMVVALKEQNAAAPEHLPKASKFVIQTAVTLAKVAHQIAAKDYSDFEAISKEINDSAHAVIEATATLTNSIEALDNTDKKHAWEGLLKACNVMAEKTIKLLQIVYGAEIKKMLAILEDLKNQSNSLDINDAGNNPEQFAEEASALAQKAAHIASILKNRALDEPLPWIRDKLAKQSDDIMDQAQNLIDRANDLINNPTDADCAKLFDDAMKKLFNSLKDILDAMKNAPSQDQQLPVVPSSSAAAAIKDDPSRIDKLVNRIRQMLDNLIRAAQDGDKETYEKLLNELAQAADELREIEKENPNLVRESLRYQDLLDLLDSLENGYPTLINDIRDIMEGDDPSRLFDATRRLKNATQRLLDQISNANQPDNLLELERKLNNKLEELKAQLRDGQIVDPKKELGGLHDQVNRLAEAILNHSQDPSHKKNILECLDRLNQAFQKLCNSINDPNQFETLMQEYLGALKALEATTHSPELSHLQTLKLCVANIHGTDDNDDLRRAAERLADITSELLNMMRPEASTKEELEDLDRAVRKELLNVIKRVESPESLEARQNLDNSKLPLIRSIQALEKKLLDPRHIRYGCVHTHKDTPSIDDSIANLLRTLQMLNGILPGLNNKSDTNRDELEKLLPLLKASVEGIHQNITVNSKDALLVTIEDLKQGCDRLQEDEPREELVQRGIHHAKVTRKFVGELEKLAEQENDSSKATVMRDFSNDAIQKLGSALKKLKELSNEEQRAEFVLLMDNIGNSLDAIRETIYDPSHDEKRIRDKGSDIKRLVSAIKKKAKDGDKEGVVEVLSTLQSPVQEFVRSSKKRRNYSTSQEDTNLDEFVDQIESLEDVVKESLNDLQSSTSHQKLQALETKLHQTILKISQSTNADDIASIQEIEESLATIQNSILYGDGSVISKECKRVIDNLSQLSKIIEQHVNPEKKEALSKSLEELHAPLKDIVIQAKAYLHGNTDTSQVTQSIADVKVLTAQMISLLSKSSDKKTLPETLRKAQAKVEDKETVNLALKSAYEFASKEDDLYKRDRIERAIVNTRVALDNQESQKTPLHKAKLQGELSQLFNECMSDCIENEVKALGPTLNILDELNPKGNTVQQDVLTTTKHIEELRDSALEVSRQKKGSYTSPKDSGKESVADLRNTLKNIKTQEKAVEEPKTFDEVLDRVADDIKQVVEVSTQSSDSTEIVSGSGIVHELRRLAQAARDGKASEMLLAARAVAKHLESLTKEMHQVVQSMGNKNPREKETLIKSSVALNNYGTQMKILTSVKVSSIEENADNDETLSSITKSIGKMLTEGIKSMEVVKTTVLKEKL